MYRTVHDKFSPQFQKCNFLTSNPKSARIIRPCRSRSAAAYNDQTFPWMICRFVHWSVGVGALVCPVHCGKTADRIRMPFGIICQTGPKMRQVVGFGDRSTGRGTFGGEFWACRCNQWGLYGVRVVKLVAYMSQSLTTCQIITADNTTV